tara:strand:+ start:37534 stop:37731 length:198 start_codon:yes stop_codon:yes gene_type:complete
MPKMEFRLWSNSDFVKALLKTSCKEHSLKISFQGKTSSAFTSKVETLRNDSYYESLLASDGAVIF